MNTKKKQDHMLRGIRMAVGLSPELPKVLNWKVSRDEQDLITTIALRASSKAKRLGLDYSCLDAEMDIKACHNNGCPLDLLGLANADDLNFGHDVFGIARHINRENGHLQNCFVPRYAAKLEKAGAR